MSAHRTGYDAYKLLEQGGLADPGNGGTIDLDAQSGMACILATAGTAILPDGATTGTVVYVVNGSSGTIVVKTEAALTVASMATGLIGIYIMGTSVWSGRTLSLAA